jgi:adenine specific DNA methylase Mod
MATYLNGIIPHDFTAIENKEKATAELNNILKQLQDYWHFTKGFNTITSSTIFIQLMQK